MSAPLAPAEAAALVPATPEQARAELERSRQRVQRALEALEDETALGTRVRAAVREHPVLVLGGALVVGWALARLLPRRKKKERAREHPRSGP